MVSKTVSLPIMKGTGKNPLVSDFVNLLPVNMLTVPPKLITDNGYMRSFPGIGKMYDVAGASRGAMKNAADGKVYRVCGNTLYRSGTAAIQIDGTDRVSLAGSNKTIAVAAGGKMILVSPDNTVINLDNWPPSQYFPGSEGVIASGQHSGGYDGSLTLTESMVDKGHIELTITPQTSTGAMGAPLVLSTVQKYYDQDAPESGTPYITDAVIEGFLISGTTLTLSYTFNANGAEGDESTEYSWSQIVEPTTINNAQYELGDVSAITHAHARYAWLKAGTNTFGVTDIDDETKPDRYRPFMTAESFPDPAVGIDTVDGDIVIFGTVSTEFFSLTGSSDSTQPIYKSQQAMLINTGIAGPYCKALAGSQFAVISHPAGGKVSVYLLGSGRATEIASPEVVRALAQTSDDELAAGVVEFISFDVHQLIIVRFGDHVFCYDLTSKNWCELGSGPESKPYIGIDFINERQSVSVGDISHGITGLLQQDLASQYGERQNHVLFTPMVNFSHSVLCDLELETVTGTAKSLEHLAVSASTDGAIFPYERLIVSDGNHHYNDRTILSNVGYVAKNIAFRFRAYTSTPFTASACKVTVT